MPKQTPSGRGIPYRAGDSDYAVSYPLPLSWTASSGLMGCAEGTMRRQRRKQLPSHGTRSYGFQAGLGGDRGLRDLSACT
jgi:hypothetical protein